MQSIENIMRIKWKNTSVYTLNISFWAFSTFMSLFACYGFLDFLLTVNDALKLPLITGSVLSGITAMLALLVLFFVPVMGIYGTLYLFNYNNKLLPKFIFCFILEGVFYYIVSRSTKMLFVLFVLMLILFILFWLIGTTYLQIKYVCFFNDGDKTEFSPLKDYNNIIANQGKYFKASDVTMYNTPFEAKVLYLVISRNEELACVRYCDPKDYRSAIYEKKD